MQAFGGLRAEPRKRLSPTREEPEILKQLCNHEWKGRGLSGNEWQNSSRGRGVLLDKAWALTDKGPAAKGKLNASEGSTGFAGKPLGPRALVTLRSARVDVCTVFG